MRVQWIEKQIEELEVQIFSPVKTSQVEHIIATLKKLDKKLVGFLEGENVALGLEEICYIESLERKTFIYTKNKVYRHSKKLYQLEEELEAYGFVKVSKSCLLNMEALASVRGLWNSRLEAILTNGEKLLISRTYIPKVKAWLNEEEQTDEKGLN